MRHKKEIEEIVILTKIVPLKIKPLGFTHVTNSIDRYSFSSAEDQIEIGDARWVRAQKEDSAPALTWLSGFSLPPNILW